MSKYKNVAIFSVLIIISMSVIFAGCEATAKSDKLEPGWQKTASYEKIMATPATQPSPLVHRNWKISQAHYTECIVTHFGSYFDDEFATQGDGNDTYGWTEADILAAVYCPVRFVVNTVCVPISMIKEPPGVLTTSYLDQSAEHYSTISSEEVLNDNAAMKENIGNEDKTQKKENDEDNNKAETN